MNSEQNTEGQQINDFIPLYWVFRASLLGLLVLVVSANWVGARQQSAKPAQPTIEKQFSDLVDSLANAALDDAATIVKLEQSALGILDSAALEALPVTPGPALDAVNSRLAKFVSRESGLGETYRVVTLGGQPPVFALVANFGLGAPSAIRIYSEQGSANHYALAARIDRSTQEDLLDDSLEVVPVPAPSMVFVTVAGRTDAEQTGVFIAWLFEAPKTLKQLWTSDLVQKSSHQVDAAGFQLTYCSAPDEDKPGVCRGMVRERYRWQDGEWRKVESVPIPVPKR